jgi:hypothetical protein
MDQPIKPNVTLVPKIICGDISLSVRLCRLAWGLTTARNLPAFNGLCTGALGARIDRPGSSDTTVRDLLQRPVCPDSAAPTSELYDLESTEGYRPRYRAALYRATALAPGLDPWFYCRCKQGPPAKVPRPNLPVRSLNPTRGLGQFRSSIHQAPTQLTLRLRLPASAAGIQNPVF